MAGVVAAGAAAMAVSLVPGSAAGDSPEARTAPAPTATPTESPVAFTLAQAAADSGSPRDVLAGRPSALELRPDAQPRQAAADDEETAETADEQRKSAEPATEDDDSGEDKNGDDNGDEAAPAAAPAEETYPDNLDGWIREALDIMDEHDIPGTYEGIHRNIIRESSGDPNAINNWDINAQNGVPSKGLLQVIKPTFDAYHVEGTAHDQYDPVANIVAACNYAADRYGSMDNVNGPY
ncbi:Transglycosylase SLT domain-containing protein [Streptomyces zhaozhouensis]|uniref:Transglycosylase SLT domain-containing protein n=1 Tax=Streptomyces zhaozhouensis TaxID=1300267 RepID=A0A286DWC4_9ACTN|nr:transglycosylase SLT domain-containing protein [Streptomyces zhaozhouensis]SOD62962.1 Transglycosylase SLT domain-containing protein [Streptomyces zhaozhouensis]